MGRQEISHQQVMSYLVGGGDFYTSHKFRSVHFYQFTAALAKHAQQIQDGENETTIGVDLSTCNEHVETMTLNTSPGEISLSSDFLDYRFRSNDTTFEQMNVWEFMELSYKTAKQTSSAASYGDRYGMETDDNSEPLSGKGRKCSQCFNFASNEHPEFDTHGLK